MANKIFNALPNGYLLRNYKIIHAINDGGYGIAYLAEHSSLEARFVIKEYFPRDFVERSSRTCRVTPRSPHQIDKYNSGLEKYITEAQIIAQFNHKNIVKATDYFKENNTAYIVMPYTPGDTLEELIKNGDKATEEEIKSIIIPLLKGLNSEAHKRGVIHCDIKPANIYIHKDKTPILIDFGAARDKTGICLSDVVTPGFSPYEQYIIDGSFLGEQADIYAIGAVMYQLVSGKVPVDAPARISDDPLIPATKLGRGSYSYKLLSAIDHAMAVHKMDRPQSINHFLLEIKKVKEDNFLQRSWRITVTVLLVSLVGYLAWKIPIQKPPKPIAPKPIAPKPIAPKPIAPKPIAPKPVAPKPIAPKPVISKPIQATWQNINSIGRNNKTWDDANNYCQNLKDNNLSNWELPHRKDFKLYQTDFKYKVIYWAQEAKGYENRANIFDVKNMTTGIRSRNKKYSVRCISKQK